MKKSQAKTEFSYKESKDKFFLYAACAVIIIVALSLFNFSLFGYPKRTVKTEKTTRSQGDIIYWEGFVKENPSYIAGWLELAKSYYKAGDLMLTLSALQSAEKIDPNSEELKNLKGRLKY